MLFPLAEDHDEIGFSASYIPRDNLDVFALLP
jgi:hypothetical protein